MSRKKTKIQIKPSSEIRLILGSGKRKNLRSFHWRAISTSSEITRSETFWSVQTNFGETALLRYLRLKTFWGEFQSEELEMAYTHPKFLNDPKFNVLLALLASTELGREEISRRMEASLKLLGEKNYFRKSLLSQWENNLVFSSIRKSRPIRKHKAYSGWVRNASSVGSKRKNLKIPEPLSEDFSEVQFDEFNFLYVLISVGSIETSSGVILRLP